MGKTQHDDNAPLRESMKRSHRVRRFRRGNAEHGRAYLGHKQKPWKKQAA